jgi:diguanylate cyclase (GGDEF)-like protein
MTQGAPVAARVHVECLDQVNRSLLRGVWLTPPATLVLVWILGDAVPLGRRLLWMTLVQLAAAASLASALRYRRRRREGKVYTRWPLGLLAGLYGGFAWASVTVIALPGPDHVELRAMCALFACGVSSTNMVGSAARRSNFYAFQLPLMLTITAVFIGDDDRVTRLLGYAVPIYLVTVILLYHEVNRVVVSEIELKYGNRDLLEDLSSANARLTALAMRDPLTGLANRTALVELLERCVGAAARAGEVVGVLYFDLDRFKIVNDSLGHSAGDELLVQVSGRVGRLLRDRDVLARLGGDEFVVLLDRLADSYEAYLIAERIRTAFADPFVILGRHIHVTPSVGVATNLHTADGAEELLRHADAAQYRAKESGRNRVEVFDIDFRAALARRLDDERAVADALAAGQIVPFFQPQIDLVTGRVVGAEALARWIHPTRGVLGAPHFIPLAEETGLIAQVDEAIIASAIRARVHLEALGVDASFRIWCNVSPRQFARVAPVERLARFLDHAGCDARGLGVEITETAVLGDVDAAAGELANARRLGIAVALDDFGTGHSSLTMLRHLPIDEVKIDQEFVRDLGIDGTDTAIVQHVASLAADLGLTVVAEGVQLETQVELLRRFGCHRAQGFLYAPAIPLPDLIQMIQRRAVPDAPDQPGWLPKIPTKLTISPG